MKILKIYYINENYIKYLRKFDKIVPYNKTHTRPYIGVVFKIIKFIILLLYQALNLSI